MRSSDAVAARDAMAAGRPDSWYEATAVPLARQPALRGAVTADVCIVGGGYTGLSAALHLAERGYDVVLLEARRFGWGASGRNGGQVGTGQRLEEARLEALYGADAAAYWFRLAEEAKELVRELIARHAIDCDLRPGQVIAAAKPSHAPALRDRAEGLATRYGYPHMRWLDAGELAELVAARGFHGGCLDTGAFHLHPLNYALGLARAALAAGVRCHEDSAVLGRNTLGHGVHRVWTADGEVRARHVVLACNGYLDGLDRRLAARIMPINNFLLATEPLPGGTTSLIRNGACVHDTRFVVNYFRPTQDGRLLFGGGETYRRRFPSDLRRFLQPYLLRIFPQLARVSIEYAWGGTLAITMSRLPHLGRLTPEVWFAHGYSGHGISTATQAGALVAEAIAGTAERFDFMAARPPRPFPGGRWLRTPGTVLGMLWYALRDRL